MFFPPKTEGAVQSKIRLGRAQGYQNKNKIMARPRLKRRIQFKPKVTSFKPKKADEGFFEPIKLTLEETEALRLKNVIGLDQTEAAKAMKTSQSTFQRILSSAYKKVSSAIIDGKEISIK